ncbi:MAG TPA: hypothetical protein VJH71_02555 [Candidatus Paceibacterota bacterium]
MRLKLPKTISSLLTKQELIVFKKLNTPRKIQDFLDKISINFEPGGDTCLSPRRVLIEQRAHCIEGAMLAATALWAHGHRPLLLDLRAADRDYDHVLALFQRKDLWGAISKTNHAVLRYREPVYKNIRELAMSFFHEYFDDYGRKNLRYYSRPFDLSKLGVGWIVAKDNLWHIAEALDDSPHFPVLNRATLSALRRADKVEIEAGKIVEWKK